MIDNEQKAWEEIVRWAMQPHTNAATFAVNYSILRAVDAEMKQLKEDLADVSFCCVHLRDEIRELKTTAVFGDFRVVDRVVK